MALWYLTFSTGEGVHGIHLEDLYVRPAFRGSGRGKARASNNLDAKGFSRLPAKTVHPSKNIQFVPVRAGMSTQGA